MEAPGGRDEGKELDPAVAGELEVTPRARVEGSAEWAGHGREAPRRGTAGNAPPPSDEGSAEG